MGRFDHLATRPARGVRDMLRWKVVDGLAGRNRHDSGGFEVPRATPDRALFARREASLLWIGHATMLLTLGGVTVLFDPIFRSRVGFMPRLGAPGMPLHELPPIDLVAVTHNHHDHLDPWSLGRIARRPARLGPFPRFVAPLGNCSVIRAAGAQRVDELDWWGSLRVGPLEITLVPARHWSMRAPWDRNEALWGGYLVRGPEGCAYHAGDTAMFDGFRTIGERAGTIDWAMLPIGSYEPRWFMEPQHICPEEAVAAAGMLRARRMVAMHWGTFRLTDEPVSEPPSRARAAWAAAGRDERDLWLMAVGEHRALAGR